MLTGVLPEPTRQLADLIRSLGSPDEIASVDDFRFAKRAGEIIARAGASMRSRNTAQRKRITGAGETKARR
jgi:hypothetical protein